MAVHWNKVTWYSKIIALALFVLLPFAGFYYGLRYGAMLQAADESVPGYGSSTPAQVMDLGSVYYQNVSTWQIDRHDDAGISIAYPIDFPINDNHALTPSTDWRVNSANSQGLKVLAVTIPAAFEPQTNLIDATFTVGYSNDKAGVSQCFSADQGGGPITASTTAIINGIHFAVFHSGDAGAGNLYETTSYRTLHGGECYAVEYTIHSGQIANYPSSYGLKPFNETRMKDVLDRMVGTFKFL